MSWPYDDAPPAEAPFPVPPDEPAVPHSYEMENAVLGALLLKSEAYDEVRGRLQADSFYIKPNRLIFKAIEAVANTEPPVPIDLVTVVGQLQESQTLDKVGGVSHLSSLASAVPTAANITFYAEKVRELHLRRETLQIAKDLAEHASLNKDVAGFVALVEQRMSKLTAEHKPEKVSITMKESVLKVWEQLEGRYASRHESKGTTGIPSGFVDLDKMTSGFQKSDLIIVAARPSVGKTAFMLNIARNAAAVVKDYIAVFSLEMPDDQLTGRMISSEAGIDAEKIKSGLFEGDDWEKLGMAASKIADLKIRIFDDPSVTAQDIRAKCRKLKQEEGLSMILIDYLQLIEGNGKGKDRQQEVSEISRTLKQIARELEVPVIALSQLSRGVEQRQNKRPMMSDLRESGSIEQDADIIAFLYRADYYDKETSQKNIIEVIIAKQRNGPVGTVELVNLKNIGKMVNLDRQQTVDDNW
ncbi:primary replicative DNA helicase [Paenibacillus algorifonticola]|uniref:Replicative DNA helicase n=1 Tax=Paenibacillus algorifonticola TaxID=684063 RepID=A0A1I2AHW0_9BACL|nr:replicative DNA helicase [Paenibacillus algorifonticola]SFE42553.1 primary replicative DNA helicase [Paenibacillus algorifonticola]